jgi:hypothetical protein
MAIVTRYFSTSGAGAADGTTWADRAELDPSGGWSTVITGFNFSGSDSLKCLIGPGTYTFTTALTSALFANAPSVANPLILHGCDSSGVALTPPDPDWVSAMPAFGDSTLPVLATTTSIFTISLANTALVLLKFTASGRNGGVVGTVFSMNWCRVVNSTANTAAVAVSSIVNIYNSVLECTGSSYDVVASACTCHQNCRIEGVAGSSGNRRGSNITGTTDQRFVFCTIVNCGVDGLLNSSTSVTGTIQAFRCVIANNGGAGFKGNPTTAATDWHTVVGCIITGNGAYGVDSQGQAKIDLQNTRLRDNTSGNINGLENYSTDLNNYTTDSDDATEYVSAGANGDFRIKNTAAIWGQGYGVSDQPAAAAVASGLLVGMGVARSAHF